VDDEPALMVVPANARVPLAALAGIWVLIGLAYAVHDASADGLSAAGHGLVFLVPAFPFAFLAMRAGPLRLTRDYLQVPGLSTNHHIPVGAIAGIGMCQYSGDRRGTPSWQMAIWTSDGAKSTFQASTVMRPGADIAGTKAAQIARELWQKVAELQPANGPLRSVALQHLVPAEGPWSRTLQVWCPDDGTSYKPGQQAALEPVAPVPAASAPVASVPLPAWYDDPVEPGRVRWWDGAQWGQQAPLS
jgi:hypothetical protein